MAKQVGELATAVVKSSRSDKSQRGSVPAARRVSYTVDNLPIARDHFLDVTIPERTWSSFTPNDGGRRKLKRELTTVERRVVTARAAALDDCLQPYGPSELDRVVEALSAMFASFSASRDVGDAAIARVKGMAESLATHPAWAIEKACGELRSRGYTVKTANGIRLEQTFPPSESQMFSIVGEVVALRAKTADSLHRLLAAEVEPAEPDWKPTPAELEAKMAEFRSRMGPGGKLLSEDDEKRRAERRDAGFKRGVDDARQSYLDAGLDPPPGEHAVLSSLPLMLSMGWVIEDRPGGGRQLVAPRRQP